MATVNSSGAGGGANGGLATAATTAPVNTTSLPPVSPAPSVPSRRIQSTVTHFLASSTKQQPMTLEARKASRPTQEQKGNVVQKPGGARRTAVTPTTKRLPVRHRFRSDFDKRPPPVREQLNPPSSDAAEKSGFLHLKSGNSSKSIRLVLRGSALHIYRAEKEDLRPIKSTEIAEIFRVSMVDEVPGQPAFRVTCIQSSPTLTFLCNNESDGRNWVAAIKQRMRAERRFPESIMEGNFKKKSHNKKFNKWDGRWFVLGSSPQGAQGPAALSNTQLFYYRNRSDDQSAEKRITIADITQIGQVEEDGEPYCLEVQTQGRTWVLSAADREDLNDWMAAIKMVMKGIKELQGWGDNSSNQLGIQDGSKRFYAPVTLHAFRGVDVVQVATGASHTLVLLDDGRVFSMGLNNYGQLGHGDDSNRGDPCLVEALEDLSVRQIACAENMSMALSDDGRVFMWGDTGRIRGLDAALDSLPAAVSALEGKFIHQISLSPFHCAVVSDIGLVFAWGENSSGQLGTGDTVFRKDPTMIAMSESGGGPPWQVACGSFHTVVVTEHGTVYTWGDGSFGQLGHGDKTSKLHPTLVEALHGDTFQMVAAGQSHTLALSSKGTVYAWGKGENGQLGLGPKAFGQKTPAAIEGFTFVGVTCGAFHSAATTRNGELYTWGKGALIGNSDDKDVSVPTLVAALGSRVGRVSCGSQNTIAICAKHQWSPSLHEDNDGSKCTACGNTLTELQRPHQCRRCLRTFCFFCANGKQSLPGLCFNDNVRLCDECYRAASEWSEPDDDDDEHDWPKLASPTQDVVELNHVPAWVSAAINIDAIYPLDEQQIYNNAEELVSTSIPVGDDNNADKIAAMTRLMTTFRTQAAVLIQNYRKSHATKCQALITSYTTPKPPSDGDEEEENEIEPRQHSFERLKLQGTIGPSVAPSPPDLTASEPEESKDDSESGKEDASSQLLSSKDDVPNHLSSGKPVAPPEELASPSIPAVASTTPLSSSSSTSSSSSSTTTTTTTTAAAAVNSTKPKLQRPPAPPGLQHPPPRPPSQIQPPHPPPPHPPPPRPTQNESSSDSESDDEEEDDEDDEEEEESVSSTSNNNTPKRPFAVASREFKPQ